jgi:hypothetical protein
MHSIKPSLRTLRGLLSASLLTCLLLSGCSLAPTKPSPPAVPDPVSYADPITVDKPPYPLTNASLTKWVNALLDALDRANDDRASIKAWADTIQGE